MIHIARMLYGDHRFDEAFLREHESEILVHSTPKEYVGNILEEMELKCWNRLKSEKVGWETEPIGSLLGDIDDFSNYVMLSDVNFNAEIIVASKQKQKITADLNQTYTPGARLYLDATKMAKDKVLLRDGVHIKVKDRIPLDQYLIWYATADILNIEGETTPREFFEKANQEFFKLFTQYK